MRVLFIHQNFPGQFRHIAGHLARRPGWVVVGLGDAANVRCHAPVAGVRTLGYAYTPQPSAGHAYLREYEEQVRRGQAVLRALLRIRREGFVPDAVCVHPSWGEALFVREAFPAARVVCYAEFHYAAEGADVGFDPEFAAPTLDTRCRLRIRNSVQLQALADCDVAWAPSHWQAGRLPEAFRDKLVVVHEGIDTASVRPLAGATFRLGERVLTAADSVLTYVARNLEPYRGFHVFMRALPHVLAQNPDTRVVIVGGDDVGYGGRPQDAAHWRERMLAEVGAGIDPAGVHFTGRLPRADYLNLLRVSRAHVYLTYPFVLSWSLLEAMACGCAIVASRTAPVEEVIADRENGLLVDFFDREALVREVSDLLRSPRRFEPLRDKARQTIEQRFDLERICLPRQLERLFGDGLGEHRMVPAARSDAAREGRVTKGGEQPVHDERFCT